MRPRAIQITSRPISVASVIRSVADASSGAVVTFVGTVRDHADGAKVTRLDLEAATDLAEGDLNRIARIAKSRFDVAGVAITHRVGKLKVGDVIVVIAVGAPHRKQAFSACRFIIDELKKSTPIWKKEHGARGARWVEGGI